MVENPPANAGDTGSSPGPGRSPHATEQLSPCATTTEPVSVSPRSTTTVESVNENVHTSVPLKKLDSSCVHSCIQLCLECQAGELEISQT